MSEQKIIDEVIEAVHAFNIETASHERDDDVLQAHYDRLAFLASEGWTGFYQIGPKENPHVIICISVHDLKRNDDT